VSENCNILHIIHLQIFRRVLMASEQVPVASKLVPVASERVPVRTQRVIIRLRFVARAGFRRVRPGWGPSGLRGPTTHGRMSSRSMRYFWFRSFSILVFASMVGG
jgi:hypothetical protein